MSDLALFVFVWQRTARAAAYDRVVRDERGEGVISAAIAVLVMAFLGVLMWKLFSETLRNSNTKVNEQITEIK